MDQKQRMGEIKVVTGPLPPGRDEDGCEGGIGVYNRGEEKAQAGEDEVDQDQDVQQALPLPPPPPPVGLPVGAQDGDV